MEPMEPEKTTPALAAAEAAAASPGPTPGAGVPTSLAAAPPPAAPAPYAAPAARPPKSPGAALVLSFFMPGMGQVYNGQVAKALVFFFGVVGCIWGAAEVGPFPFAPLIPFLFFFSLVDAYRGASLINARAAGGLPPEEDTIESPAWGASLVVLGLALLLNNLGWISLAALRRYWPLLLIAAGAALVWNSINRRKETGDGSAL